MASADRSGKSEFTDASVAEVDAELATPIAIARIVRFHKQNAANRNFRRKDRYWLDLCLTARPLNARACYPDIWAPHRFEPIGELLIVPPDRTMNVRSDEGVEQISIVCEIEAAAVDRWLGEGGVEWNDRRLAAALDVSSQSIRFCLARLAGETRHRTLGTDVVARALTEQLAVEVARYCEAVSDQPITGGLASWRLRLIDERIQDFANPPSLGELAMLCNMSKRQLTRAFRTSRDVSVGDYVAHARLDAARRMLASDRNIKAIAFDLGFASPSAFSNAFRRLTGMTPRQFRARQLRDVMQGRSAARAD